MKRVKVYIKFVNVTKILMFLVQKGHQRWTKVDKLDIFGQNRTKWTDWDKSGQKGHLRTKWTFWDIYTHLYPFIPIWDTAS